MLLFENVDIDGSVRSDGAKLQGGNELHPQHYKG